MADPSERLAREAVEAHYDRFGVLQDGQAYYEDPAFAWLIAHGFDMGPTEVDLIEFGCGTGRFAGFIAEAVGSTRLRYRGFDVSETMVALARERLGGVDAHVIKTDGSMRLPVNGSDASHFAVTFVLDLLSPADQASVLAEACRVLKPNGRLLLASLDRRARGLARLTAWGWRMVHAVAPMRVGGCRPVALTDVMAGHALRLVREHRFSALGLGVHCVVARKT